MKHPAPAIITSDQMLRLAIWGGLAGLFGLLTLGIYGGPWLISQSWWAKSGGPDALLLVVALSPLVLGIGLSWMKWGKLPPLMRLTTFIGMVEILMILTALLLSYVVAGRA